MNDNNKEDFIEEMMKIANKLAEKDALLQEAARLLEDVVMKEGWIRADKLARRIRESLGGGKDV